ncbi:hypothetical protein PACTADRAFT_2941 [Pachysolen tannophilus NRRL Y-2460]|uniref:Vacuolar-sorting protein SNF7 n=1 Tax=Pachysolen tannophilus NRRL Y-2460 TaxID=669874 RepID=A0A1E4TU18_PACTA|nr:hypothetical protein PACTADRAFT_2941 [Pachysolen tannophilus NRRL Y-2460]
MFSYFFGNNQKKKDEPKKRIVEIREQINLLNKKSAHLERQIDEQQVVAKKSITTNKAAAKMALKRKKNYEIQHEKIQSQVDNLEQLLFSIENANLNSETMNVMKNGAKAIKQIHGDFDMDKVEDTMDEIREQLDVGQEISEAISRPLGQEIDEDELDEELEALQQEELDKNLVGDTQTKNKVTPIVVNDKDKNNNNLEMPDVSGVPKLPAHKIATQEDEDEDEEALRALQAEMGITSEFQQCVTSFTRLNKQRNNSVYNNNNGHNQGLQQQHEEDQQVNKSEFSKRASGIAKDIAHITELLGKLALLAKRNQFLDDRSTEIQELTYVIKQSIFKVEKNLKNLSGYINGEYKFNNSNNNNDQIGLFSKNVVQLLNTKTKNVSEEFKNVLEIRQKNELANKSRQEQFLSMASNSISSQAQQQQQQNQLLQPSMNTPTASDNPFLLSSLPSSSSLDQDPATSAINSELLSLPNQDQQLLLLEEQQQESSRYLQERSRAVETIESTINEVGNLFQQLATMVNEQGEQIQRIDANVEDISLNIQGAQRELMKYYHNISNNRWFMFKIFAVIIFFFMIWVLVS